MYQSVLVYNYMPHTHYNIELINSILSLDRHTDGSTKHVPVNARLNFSIYTLTLRFKENMFVLHSTPVSRITGRLVVLCVVNGVLKHNSRNNNTYNDIIT